MRFKQIIAGKAGLPEEIIPNTYQMLGKVLLLKLSHPQALKAKKKIAAAILKTFPYVKTVALQKGVSGEFRQPKVEIIAGEKKTLTIHKELSCSFKLDVKKIMWSKGNHHERKRLLRLVKPNEIIYYVNNFCPYDKAGAYGIQDWFGLRFIKRVEGCFYNVMGLPVSRVLAELEKMKLLMETQKLN